MDTKNVLQPADVTDLDMAFGANAMKLLPSYSDIPREFKNGHTKWNDLMNDWFFCGVKDLNITAKDGIDKAKALRHIRSIIGSFEPQHEHKEAGVAYLMSMWFQDATWKRAK